MRDGTLRLSLIYIVFLSLLFLSSVFIWWDIFDLKEMKYWIYTCSFCVSAWKLIMKLTATQVGARSCLGHQITQGLHWQYSTQLSLLASILTSPKTQSNISTILSQQHDLIHKKGESCGSSPCSRTKISQTDSVSTKHMESWIAEQAFYVAVGGGGAHLGFWMRQWGWRKPKHGRSKLIILSLYQPDNYQLGGGGGGGRGGGGK